MTLGLTTLFFQELIFIEVEKSFGFRIFFCDSQISLFIQNLFFFVLSLKHFGCLCHFGLLVYNQMEEVLYFSCLFVYLFFSLSALLICLFVFSLNSSIHSCLDF